MTTTHPSLHDDLELAALLAYQADLHEQRIAALGGIRSKADAERDRLEAVFAPFTPLVEGVDIVESRPCALVTVGGMLWAFDVERLTIACAAQCSSHEDRVRCDAMTTTTAWMHIDGLLAAPNRLASIGAALSRRSSGGAVCHAHGPF